MTLPPKYPLQTLMATEAKHVAELNKILTMSVSRLDKDIKALYKSGAAPLTLMQAKATKAALENFLAQTFDGIEGVIKNGVRDAAAAASGVVSAYEAQLLGLVMSPEAVANLAKAEAQRAAWGIEAAMQRVQGNSYQPLASSVYKTQQLTLKWVDKRIAQGLASGWSAQKLAGELAGMINPAVKGGVSYAAMRTARTEINNAFHASSTERYLNSPVVLEVDWNLSSSHPEGDICDSLASDSPYPKKSVPQKPHPQCYCYITPVLPEPAKFVDNLFKGKYGKPPEGAAVNAVKANLPKAAGSKAASTMSQQAMHQAIKTDPKPTKATIGNQLNLDKGLTAKIVDPAGVQQLLAKLDNETLDWIKKTPSVKKMFSQVDSEVDDLDTLAAWAKKQANPKSKIQGFQELPKPPVTNPEAWDDLMEFFDSGQIAAMQKAGVDPEKVYYLIQGMDEVDFHYFTKIVMSAEDSSTGIKNLLNTMDLDSSSNSFSGSLKSYASGTAPKKITTTASLAEDFKLPYNLRMDLLDEGLTLDQIEAQLLKFSADDLATIYKLPPKDATYYVKMGTTPPPAAMPKPMTPAGAPSYEDLAKLLKISADDIMESGATPQQVWFMMYGDETTGGLLKQLQMSTAEVQKVYMNSAKLIDLPKHYGDDYAAWMKKHGFVEATDDIKVKYSFAELEADYGTPASMWEGTGWTADDIKGAFNWIDEYDSVLQKQIENAFDEFDQDMLHNAIKQGLAKKKNPTIVDPQTLPKPVVPNPIPVPKELYDSYEDVADIYIKGEWKPNLLAKTGASPQQIADYVEDMNQAQYDHFMSLKWPSQKKHFEKLAANKVDNAAAYQAKIDVAQGAAADLSKVKKPLTSDPEVLDKWRGKAQPGKPIEPKPPTTPGKATYDEFLEKSKAKFKDFAASTGNPKNDLTLSNNWSYFQKVVNDNDLSALKYLQANKYIDQDLYDLAIAASKKATTPNPADALAYKKGMDAYAKLKDQFDADMVNWRAANGITSQAKGTWEGALVHTDNSAGVAWANKTLPVAQGSARSAVQKYSGSSYHEWNSTLRKHANGDAVPSGTWGEFTRNADKAMVGVPEDVVVRRGTGWDEFHFGGKRNSYMPPPPPHELIGSVQTNHGYISTSVGNSAAFGGQVQMRIRVPQGHGAAWVDPYSSHKGERELLLSRSSNMYIHDVYQEGNQWYVDAEIIPHGEDASSWMPIKSARRR